MVKYLIIISLAAFVLTVYDKLISKKKKKKKGKKKRKKTRVPEKLFWAVAILGGAAAEYITMKIIRHKTKHKSFMRGLPAIIIIQIGLYLAYYFLF